MINNGSLQSSMRAGTVIFCANVSSCIVERLSACKTCLHRKVKCMNPDCKTRRIESKWWHENTYLDRKVAQGTAGYKFLTNHSHAFERNVQPTAIWIKGQSELILFNGVSIINSLPDHKNFILSSKNICKYTRGLFEPRVHIPLQDGWFKPWPNL